MKKLGIAMIAGIILLGLLGAGCNLFFNPNQTGGLEVIIGDRVSRSTTLFPDFDMSPVSYDVFGIGPDGENFSLTDAHDDYSEWASLAPGSWTVTVHAYNAEGQQIGSGNKTVIVEANVTKQVIVTVRPLTGTGILDLEIRYNAEEITDPVISAVLKPSAGGDERTLEFDLNTIIGNATYFSDDIPTGYHSLIIRLYDGETFETSQIHAVRIIKDQVTETVFDLGRTLYGVGGTVVDESGEGIEGATVSFSHGYESVVTNAEGLWSKNGLDPFVGPVRVTASVESYAFSPGYVDVTGTRNDIFFVGMTVNEFSHNIVLHSSTRILPASEFENIYEISEDTILFTEVTEYLSTLQVGDIIVASDIPYEAVEPARNISQGGVSNYLIFAGKFGLLSEITAISEDRKTFTITDAYLEDVIAEGFLEETEFVTADYIIEQIINQSDASRSLFIEKTRQGKIKYSYSPASNVNFKGSISVTGLSEAHISTVFNDGLKSFEVYINPGFEFEQELIIGADVDWSVGDADELFTISLPPIPIWGPVSIVFEISFLAGAEVDAQAGIITGVGYSRGYKLGIRYQDNTWTRITQETGDGKSIEDPILGGRISARVYSGIQLAAYGGVRYIGEAGIGVIGLGNIETSAQIALLPEFLWQYDFEAYLTSSAFAELRFMRFARLNHEFASVDFFNTNLAYGISGRVADSSGNGIEDVNVTFSDGFSSVTTNSDGYWQKHLLRGDVVVTPQKDGFFFYPESHTVSRSSSGNNFLSTEQLEEPEFSVSSGTYDSVQFVEIITPMPEASVRYTTDGSTPTEDHGTVYAGEQIEVASSTTIKAVAYLEGYANSPVATGNYTISFPPAAVPSFSVSPGTYTSSRSVSITSTTSGATIRYTTNGSNPSQTHGTVYTGPVTISNDTTLKAVAYRSGYSVSGIRTGTYYIRPLGTVSGTVVDSITGSGIGGVSVGVQGLSGYSTTSASNGNFSFGIPSGTRTLTFHRTGYTIPNVSVGVGASTTTTIPQSSIIGNSDVPSGNWRAVLTWGEHPRDLDFHLRTPNGQHVFFGNRSPTGAGANLDRDDTTGFGPETITITSMQSGTYTFYVHRFAGTGTLSSSNAVVRVFNEHGLARTIYVPTSGTGDYWRVFTFNNGAITTVNQITSTPP